MPVHANKSMGAHMLLQKEVGNLPRNHEWMQRLAEGADLPGEALPGISLVEIAGNSRVLIEYHKGIFEYLPQCIGVRVSFGKILVTGEALQLKHICRERLIISGDIRCVQLEKAQ